MVDFHAGERPARPELCLPPSGSSAHLSKYAPAYGCPKYGNRDVINNCMFKKLDLILKRLGCAENKVPSAPLPATRVHGASLTHVEA